MIQLRVELEQLQSIRNMFAESNPLGL